jgi:hypothetical protein
MRNKEFVFTYLVVQYVYIYIYHRNSNNNIDTKHIDINTHNISNNINNSNKY